MGIQKINKYLIVNKSEVYVMDQKNEVVLNNGKKMPIIGLGVYKIAPSAALPVFQWYS